MAIDGALGNSCSPLPKVMWCHTLVLSIPPKARLQPQTPSTTSTITHADNTQVTAGRDRCSRWPRVPVMAVLPMKWLSPKAAAKSAAEANRSAGTFSSDWATAAATLGGTDLRSSVTGAASSEMIFMMICWAVPPRCGGAPASISYNTLPSE